MGKIVIRYSPRQFGKTAAIMNEQEDRITALESALRELVETGKQYESARSHLQSWESYGAQKNFDAALDRYRNAKASAESVLKGE